MTKPDHRTLRRIAIVERRDVLLGLSAAGALLTLLGVGAARAQQSATPATGTGANLAPGVAPAGSATQVTWQEAMRALIGDAQPVEGRITLDMAELAENGNVVPFSVAVDSPMSEADHVKVVHIFSTGNPRPDVASLYFTLQNGIAKVSSRLRLGRTQDVIAVAEMSDGKFYLAKRMVKVTIGGCGGG